MVFNTIYLILRYVTSSSLRLNFSSFNHNNIPGFYKTCSWFNYTSENLEPSLRKFTRVIVSSFFLRRGCLKIIQVLPSFPVDSLYRVVDRKSSWRLYSCCPQRHYYNYRRSDLETVSECVRVEICIPGNRNLLISCFYFAPSAPSLVTHRNDRYNKI